jgi:hypothetical protein
MLLRTRLNPFDVKALLFAKHAQHVVLIHFPIALFVTAVGFDLLAHWAKQRPLADVAYYNPVSRSDFDARGYRDRYSRVAVPTGGTEAKGRPVVAPSTCVRFKRFDLASVVGTLPLATKNTGVAKLPPRN